MIYKWCIWKNLQNLSWRNPGTVPALFWRDWGKRWKTSVRMSDTSRIRIHAEMVWVPAQLKHGDVRRRKRQAPYGLCILNFTVVWLLLYYSAPNYRVKSAWCCRITPRSRDHLLEPVVAQPLKQFPANEPESWLPCSWDPANYLCTESNQFEPNIFLKSV
jgi:hypothetical protein